MGYISKEAIEKMLENAQIISDGENCGYCTDDISISSIPAADVVPVMHGKLNHIQEDMPCCYYGICSVCGNYVQAWNFCPNCGAKMDEDS